LASKGGFWDNVTVEKLIHSVLPLQAESTDMLLSQLAETSAQEKVLLEECGHLLSVAASLEVQNTFTGQHIVGWQVKIEQVCLWNK
jgi:hypothetical protein